MRVAASALKRGIPEEDMRHALGNYQLVYPAEGEHEIAMFIGPGRDGTMLEVGVIEDDDPRIIHAMPARSKYWPPPRR